MVHRGVKPKRNGGTKPMTKKKGLVGLELTALFICDGSEVKNMFSRSREVVIKDGKVFEKCVPKDMAVER